ncbi:hypothetical protein JGD54_25465 [Salmonella enterica subsp. enterica serovar Typhimurium]|nr:hypothetical protein [Salmonella enterica subsp. enterica serovar Typhimurium]
MAKSWMGGPTARMGGPTGFGLNGGPTARIGGLTGFDWFVVRSGDGVCS